MIRVNIGDVKTHLSEYLAKVEAGEIVVICKRNVPIAEIHAIPQNISHHRPLGLAKGDFEIPDSFFEQLPDDILDSFLGKDK